MSKLKEMRELLSDPARWGRKHCALDAQGDVTEVLSPNAVCWCVFGAALKVSGENDPIFSSTGWLWDELNLVVKQFPPEIAKDGGGHYKPIGLINDDPRVSHEMILSALDKAIAVREARNPPCPALGRPA